MKAPLGSCPRAGLPPASRARRAGGRRGAAAAARCQPAEPARELRTGGADLRAARGWLRPFLFLAPPDSPHSPSRRQVPSLGMPAGKRCLGSAGLLGNLGDNEVPP